MGSGYGLPPLQDKAVSLRILGQKKTHVGISETCSHGDCTATLVVKWDRNYLCVFCRGRESFHTLFGIIYVVCQKNCLPFAFTF